MYCSTRRFSRSTPAPSQNFRRYSIARCRQPINCAVCSRPKRLGRNDGAPSHPACSDHIRSRVGGFRQRRISPGRSQIAGGHPYQNHRLGVRTRRVIDADRLAGSSRKYATYNGRNGLARFWTRRRDYRRAEGVVGGNQTAGDSDSVACIQFVLLDAANLPRKDDALLTRERVAQTCVNSAPKKKIWAE